MTARLTRRQQEIYDFLRASAISQGHPPTLSELCHQMGLSSKGSMHKQVQALVDAGLVEPMNNQRRGIRLVEAPEVFPQTGSLPLLGYIAAGQPIEAITREEAIPVPPALHTDGQCYVLQVKGDSMIEEGIFDGDWVVIESRNSARNGEIVVALVDHTEATLKRIEQRPGEVVLHPANSSHRAQHYSPDRVEIQGVLVGQMRSYR